MTLPDSPPRFPEPGEIVLQCPHVDARITLRMMYHPEGIEHTETQEPGSAIPSKRCRIHFIAFCGDCFNEAQATGVTLLHARPWDLSEPIYHTPPQATLSASVLRLEDLVKSVRRHSKN